MRHLLLLLILANVLYFMWGMYAPEDPDVGVAIVKESDLGPPLIISERGVEGAATSVGAVLGSGKPTDLAAVVGQSCVTVGPFKQESDALQAREDYEQEGMRTAVRTTQGEVFVGHWVQIRNIGNRTVANAMLETLREGGLGDAYLIGGEEEGLNISLGLFEDATRAEKIELQAKSLDLPADIVPRSREAAIYFLDIGLPPGKGAGSMIARYGEERVLLREAATCPGSG
ncbi:MAG: hypothetical protein KJO31_15225 [Gammaproteobacteria bacterium]|nr:hypothetical protein [Gammaproteobacteria bacterium]